MDTCTNCEGTGVLAQFAHIQGGVCYQCSGTGKHVVKESTGLNDEACDVIYNLTQTIDGLLHWFSFCIWHEGTGKERAGTANVLLATIEEGDDTTRVIDQDGISLADARQHYKSALVKGYTQANKKDYLLLDSLRLD